MTADVIDSYPIELIPPAIDAHRDGNTGIPYVTSWQADAAGPHVVLTAIVHGNELCGAIVLDEMLRRRPRLKRGRLTLAFANIAAFQRFDPANPTASRFVDEDFNRLWSAEILAGGRDSVELRRARVLRPVIDAADFLLDIHSMQHPTPPLMMAGPTAKGRALAAAIGYPELVVADAGHEAGPRMRDYGDFIDPKSARNALLIECGQHWAAGVVDVARATVGRLLAHFDILGQGLWPTVAQAQSPGAPPAGAPPTEAQRVIEVTHTVTIASDAFRFVADVRGLEVIAAVGTIIAHDGERPVRTPHDDCVLIMPSRRLIKGQTAVRLGRYIDAEVARRAG